MTSGNQSPLNNSQTTSSRERRREKLRNIPGACTAYVCDRSPPRIAKTPQSVLKTYAHKKADVKFNGNREPPRIASSTAVECLPSRSKSSIFECAFYGLLCLNIY